MTCSCTDYLIDLPIKEMDLTQNETEGLSSLPELIFEGTLIDTNVINNKIDLIFKINKYYKNPKSDTITIRTNNGSDACGFWAPLQSNSLIFSAQGKDNLYYTYRSDCCKSISQESDSTRYKKYIKFLDIITDMKDGNYIFYQRDKSNLSVIKKIIQDII